MLVFWNEGLVLFAVPKTGSTALEGALAPRASLVLRDPPVIKHANVARYRRFSVPLLAQAGDRRLERVAVVREPVAWLGSWFRYRQRAELAGRLRSTRGISFDDFVLSYASGAPEAFADVGSQARFLAAPQGEPPIEHVFRYEDQPRLLAFLGARLGAPVALPRLNVSPRMPLRLRPATEVALRASHSADFALWEGAAG